MLDICVTSLLMLCVFGLLFFWSQLRMAVKATWNKSIISVRIKQIKPDLKIQSVSSLALSCIWLHIHWVLGALCALLKLLGHEADHSAPSNVEVKNVWSYISVPPYSFMILYLRDASSGHDT